MLNHCLSVDGTLSVIATSLDYFHTCVDRAWHLTAVSSLLFAETPESRPLA